MARARPLLLSTNLTVGALLGIQIRPIELHFVGIHLSFLR